MEEGIKITEFLVQYQFKEISFARTGKLDTVEIATKRNWVGLDLQ